MEGRIPVATTKALWTQVQISFRAGGSLSIPSQEFSIGPLKLQRVAFVQLNCVGLLVSSRVRLVDMLKADFSVRNFS